MAVVRGHDRRITRYISQWTREQADQDGRPVSAGIRYVSAVSGSAGLFDDAEMEELDREPILANDPAYLKVARLYDLTPY